MKAVFPRPVAGMWTVILLGVASIGAVAQSDTPPTKIEDELSSLHERIEATIADATKLETLIDKADGGIRTMLEHRLEIKQHQLVDDINSLSTTIVEQEAAGKDVAKMRKIATDYLQRLMPAFQRQVDQQNDKMIGLISAEPPEDLRAAMSRVLTMVKATTSLVDWYAA
ncbi:MAG: hypothetical protein QNL90_16715, partial [Gammaproteobacteria bacterium]|nr:hypothetical protein [Gammaproteobacteria bacterium]MDX2461788.1 hypothetical protein [Gammaproteobacteria bacterium]